MAKKGAKRPFTLIEMLLVMALIATALGMISLPIAKALKGEKFERGVDQIISKLALAQELMLDFQTNVRVKLHHDHDTVECLIETAAKLPEKLEKSINRHSKIAGIQQMAFDASVRVEIEICYDAALGTISKGILTLMSQNREHHLLLRGYPAQIRRGMHEEEKECYVPYPEEMLSLI